MKVQELLAAGTAEFLHPDVIIKMLFSVLLSVVMSLFPQCFMGYRLLHSPRLFPLDGMAALCNSSFGGHVPSPSMRKKQAHPNSSHKTSDSHFDWILLAHVLIPKLVSVARGRLWVDWQGHVG